MFVYGCNFFVGIIEYGYDKYKDFFVLLYWICFKVFGLNVLLIKLKCWLIFFENSSIMDLSKSCIFWIFLNDGIFVVLFLMILNKEGNFVVLYIVFYILIRFR